MRAESAEEMESHKTVLREGGWHVLASAGQLAEEAAEGCVSVVVSEEACVASLIALLVNSAGATRVAYTNCAPLQLGGGKALLIADVTMAQLLTGAGSMASREDGVVTVAASAEVGAERFHVHEGVSASAFCGGLVLSFCVLVLC